MKFAVGDKAVDKTVIKPRTSFPVMEVVGVLGDALLLQFWGDGFSGEISKDPFTDEMYEPGSRSWREGLMRFTEEELFTPDEALAEIKKLEAAKSKLDDEFDGVRDQIAEKMAQAASLAKEAVALMTPFDRDFCDLRQECLPLYDALDEGGWRPSHMRC